ncbi:MAG: GDSL-type esterase/lipase family protein [Patescibacteria group bacterium]|nr:GDSL-type esterase/lipase family protein [Patescibacteria group bacterium]MDD4304409.1 GDSL-type esterase/lipase family protein [Patescibacteria group bacterium]MDD4695432.1 GDSL-type esterase/lipase family protein [Patescibacteria group bacterium]
MNICIYGASITWGASDSQCGGWAERLKSYCIENHDDINVYNLGIPGNTTKDLLKRFESEAKIRKSDFAIFAIGTNDSSYIKSKDNPLVSLKEFNKNFLRLIKIAKKMKNKVVFVGLTRVDESKTMPVYWDDRVYYDNENIEKYDTEIKNICSENKFDYVEMKNIVSLNDLDDGIHPNSQGHEKMFEEVFKIMKKYL